MTNWNSLKKSFLISRFQILSFKNSAAAILKSQPVILILPVIGASLYVYFLAQIPKWLFDIFGFTAELWQNGVQEPLLQLNFILSISLLVFSFFFFTLFVPERRAPLWLHSLPLSNSRLTFGNFIVSFYFFLSLVIPPLFIISGIISIASRTDGLLVYLYGFLGTASFVPWIVVGLLASRALRFGLPKTKRGKIIFIGFGALAAAYFLLGIIDFRSFLYFSPGAIFPFLIYAESLNNFIAVIALWLAWILVGAVLFLSAALIGRFHSPNSKKLFAFKNYFKDSSDNFYILTAKRMLRHKEILLTLIISAFIMFITVWLANKAAGQGIPAGENIFSWIIILGISAAILVPTIDNSLGWLWASSPQGRKNQFKLYLAASFGYLLFFFSLMILPLIFNLVSETSLISSVALFIFCLSAGLLLAILGNVKLNNSFSMLALAIVYALIAGSTGWLFSFIGGRFGQIASNIIMIMSAIGLYYLSGKQLNKKQWENLYDF